jgi:predicted CXXCH cytochrome family protein
MRLCGECHRSPQTIPEDELEITVDLPRFAGTALGASKCYQKSGGKLSCVSCHDPHAGVSKKVDTYEKVCVSCHGGQTAAQKPCPVKPKSGCISCHMPPQALGDPEEVKFHNHWIRIYKDSR